MSETTDQPTDESTPEPWTFNWHTLKEYDYDQFLRWALIHLTVSEDSGVELLPQLKQATDDFTHVRLYVEVNGVVVNPRHMFEAIHSNMGRFTQTAAAEALEELTQFRELRATLTVLQEAAVRRVEQIARGLGIDLDVERLREDVL